jgi:hypothetical protein
MPANRRRFLSNVSLGAGGLLLAPVARALEAQAAGKAEGAKRFLFVMEGNGLPWQQIQPLGIERNGATQTKGGVSTVENPESRDRLVTQPLDGHGLPKALEPLEPWKDRVTILQGLSGRVTGGGHSTDFGALGCYAAHGGAGRSGTPQGETIDVALGKRLGGIFPQFSLGITDRPQLTAIYNCSAWGRGKPAPTQCRPDLAYATLFGSAAEGKPREEFLARGHVLDFLRDDVKRLEREVGAAEREKLALHLEAYEALRERHSRLNEIGSTLRKHAPVVDDKYRSDVETDRLDAHFDLAAAALIGGLTNVVTIASGVGSPYFVVRFAGLGIPFSKHGIGHGESYNGRTWEDMSVTIRRFHFELIARLMKKLAAVPEGNGTMLDNTLIIYLSDAAEAHHSRCLEWPMVLVGNLGGALRAGRYVEYPYWGLAGHKTTGNLFTSLLGAVGDKRSYFGVSDPLLKHLDLDGPLPELLG